MPEGRGDGGRVDACGFPGEEAEEDREKQELGDEVDGYEDGAEGDVALGQAGEAEKPIGAGGDEVDEEAGVEQGFPEEEK